jgi:hypothetical protein
MGMSFSSQNHGKGWAIEYCLVPSGGSAPGWSGGSGLPKGEKGTSRSGDGNQFDYWVGSIGWIQGVDFSGERKFVCKVSTGKIWGIATEWFVFGD